MQVSPKDLIFFIALASVIFLIAPVSLIIFVVQYINRKKRNEQEKEWLKTNFENELLKSQIEVQEQTMQNLAGNLHDNIGQLLSLMVVTLSTINPEEPARVSEKVFLVTDLAKRTIKELRQLSRMMYGQELISAGFAKAIGFELEYLEGAGLYKVNFESNYVPQESQQEKEIILFRIFQELLNNIVRHAAASSINIRLDQTSQRLLLIVKDDGKGFIVEDVMKEKKGMGLFNVRKRAALISGEVDITSSPGNGAEIKIMVTYR